MTSITGSGPERHVAKVKSTGELCVRSDSIGRESTRARDGFRYVAGAGEYNLPSGFDGPVLWVRNDDNDRDFIISTIFSGWNGGDTNHDRVITVTSKANATIPTANNTASALLNTNLGSSRTADATVFIWDGVGTTGMSTTNGTVLSGGGHEKGSVEIDFKAATIIPAGASFSMSLAPEEAGVASVGFVGWFEDAE